MPQTEWEGTCSSLWARFPQAGDQGRAQPGLQRRGQRGPGSRAGRGQRRFSRRSRGAVCVACPVWCPGRPSLVRGAAASPAEPSGGACAVGPARWGAPFNTSPAVRCAVTGPVPPPKCFVLRSDPVRELSAVSCGALATPPGAPVCPAGPDCGCGGLSPPGHEAPGLPSGGVPCGAGLSPGSRTLGPGSRDARALSPPGLNSHVLPCRSRRVPPPPGASGQGARARRSPTRSTAAASAS